MIADAREFWTFFALAISETGFAGILARVNGRKLIIVFKSLMCVPKDGKMCLILPIGTKFMAKKLQVK